MKPTHRIIAATHSLGRRSAELDWGWDIVADLGSLIALDRNGEPCQIVSSVERIVSLPIECNIYLGRNWLHAFHGNAPDIREVLERHKAAGGRVIEPERVTL